MIGQRSKLILLISLIAAHGAARAQQPDGPPPAPDYFPKTWKEFNSLEGGFRVSLPGPPSTSTEIKPGNSVLHSFTYGSGTFIFYSVTYRDLPKSYATEKEARDFLNGIRDTRLLGMEGKMELLSQREITRDGQPALFLEIHLLTDRRLRELDVIRGARHYNLIVITFNNHQAMGSANAYGEIANSFIDSFHLLEPTVPKSSVH